MNIKKIVFVPLLLSCLFSCSPKVSKKEMESIKIDVSGQFYTYCENEIKIVINNDLAPSTQPPLNFKNELKPEYISVNTLGGKTVKEFKISSEFSNSATIVFNSEVKDKFEVESEHIITISTDAFIIPDGYTVNKIDFSVKYQKNNVKGTVIGSDLGFIDTLTLDGASYTRGSLRFEAGNNKTAYQNAQYAGFSFENVNENFSSMEVRIHETDKRFIYIELAGTSDDPHVFKDTAKEMKITFPGDSFHSLNEHPLSITYVLNGENATHPQQIYYF